MRRPLPRSEFVQKGLPCPECTSSDAGALYDDGHIHCFSCGKTFNKSSLERLKYDAATGDPSGAHSGATSHSSGNNAPMSDDPLARLSDSANANAIKSRHLTAASCAKWSYLTRTSPKGDKEQIAFYTDGKGNVVAAKVRNTGPHGTDKDFAWLGHGKQVTLYGRHLWTPNEKLSVIVTEGEIDAISMSQIQDHKWPVVSIPNGAPTAAKDIAKNLDWLNGFGKVVFAFDMDGPGQDAAVECAKLMLPGKAFIMHLPCKDINAALIDGKSSEVQKAFWNARPYRPDGLIDARELTAKCLDPVVAGLPWPWEFMTNWTYGRRNGEVYTIGAGTGIGKSDFMAEIVACTLTGITKEGLVFQPEGFAVFSYESGDAPSKKQIAGKIARRRFHIPQGEGPEWGQWTAEEHRLVQAQMDGIIWDNGGKLFINKSQGLANWEDVKDRCRFARHADGVRNFIIDPISALVVGQDSQREFLDEVMMEMQLLSIELDSKFYAASHLTRPAQGPSHEEGGQVRLNQFRGSNAIGMSSSYVFGIERNTQAENEVERSKDTIRVVKDRYTGNANGKTKYLWYNLIEGTLDTQTEDGI